MEDRKNYKYLHVYQRSLECGSVAQQQCLSLGVALPHQARQQGLEWSTGYLG
jgi:hypothetical protein